MVNRAVGKENKEVILDGHAFLRLVPSRLEMFVDDWVLQWDEHDPLKTVGREICRQRPHLWQNSTSNQGLAWEVYVGSMPSLSMRECWLVMRMEDL